MGELATQFGGKQPGELIQAKHWNGLVDGVEALGAALDARVQALEAKVDGRLQVLERQVNSLDAGFRDLKGTVDLLLSQARRVSLRTERVRYAIGELAEITARVTDARGNPLDLAAEAARPWVDFVSTWGHLRPVSGFRSVTGTGDRTLSVQVNAQGEAKVQLRSEHAEGFTTEVETHVATSLTTVPQGTTKSVRDTILEANTPMEANLRGAFQVMSQEYDRTDAVNVRDYVDTYFVRNPTRVVGKLPALSHDTWRDYRSTVLAFVKGDSDPSTPEPGQGVCSIQVTFRDWIGPWIHLDYLPKAEVLARDLSDTFKRRTGRNFEETAANLKEEVTRNVLDKGVIAKHRAYRAIGTALDRLPDPASPQFLRSAARSVRNAISVQQTVEVSDVTFGAESGQSAFLALTDVSVQAESNASTQKVAGLVQLQIGDLEERLQKKVESVNGKIGDIQQELGKKADFQVLGRFLQADNPGRSIPRPTPPGPAGPPRPNPG